jgi:undecaprenyl-diphosphatase
MPPGRQPLPLRHALALGLAQGPTELLPVSSSGHISLIPWLCGWSHDALEPESRKAFEVVLHAGAGLALAVAMRAELAGAVTGIDRRRSGLLALSLGPPALAGLVLRGPIERRLGGPRSIAAGLFAGAVAMTLADAAPPEGKRRLAQAGASDGLVLGLAQALALIPGVSRSGATLTAARARGFGRRDAQTLSLHAALPVIAGASGLELLRMARRGAPADVRPALATGGAAAFVSTLLATKLLGVDREGRRGRTLLPYAIYRSLLAIVVVRRLRSAHNRYG